MQSVTVFACRCITIESSLQFVRRLKVGTVEKATPVPVVKLNID
jgi:hypothetical protein